MCIRLIIVCSQCLFLCMLPDNTVIHVEWCTPVKYGGGSVKEATVLQKYVVVKKKERVRMKHYTFIMLMKEELECLFKKKKAKISGGRPVGVCCWQLTLSTTAGRSPSANRVSSCSPFKFPSSQGCCLQGVAGANHLTFSPFPPQIHIPFPRI